MVKPLSVLLGAATLAALAPAQVTKSGPGYLLRVKYASGQVLRYATSNSVAGVTGQPGNLKVSLPIVMRVTEVKGPTANIRMTVGPATAGTNVLTNAQTVVMSLNSRNEAKGSTAAGVGAQLPAKPVKVGDKWSAQVPIATATGSQQRLMGTYRFQGVKSIGGRQVAVITYSVAGAAKGSGTMTLLMSDGTLWTNQMKLSLSSTGTAPMTLVSTLKRA
jgi:hypothetical protein